MTYYPALFTLRTGAELAEHVIRSLVNEIIAQAEEANFVLNWTAQDEESAIAWKSI